MKFSKCPVRITVPKERELYIRKYYLVKEQSENNSYGEAGINGELS